MAFAPSTPRVDRLALSRVMTPDPEGEVVTTIIVEERHPHHGADDL